MPDLSLNDTAGAAGTVTLTVRPHGTRPWRVTQVSVEMLRTDTAAVSGTAAGVLRKNGRLVSPFVAQGDAVAGDPPIDLQLTDVMTIEWTACNSGDICRAMIIYEVL